MGTIRAILKEVVNNPEKRILYLRKLGIYDKLDDKEYLSRLFIAKVGRKIDWDNPLSFNEKLQWLKVYDRKPQYTIMVDKYEAKRYVADIIGNEVIIPTLGVWNSFDDIEFDTLPNRFVLKCTHDSGGIVICKDKNKLDLKKSKKILQKGINTDYYLRGGREWPYKNVPHRIIAEQYMEQQGHSDGLIDYKFYCFNGEPKFLYVSIGLSNHSTAQMGFVNLDWKLEKFGRSDYLPLKNIPPKPNNFDRMIEIARKLSSGGEYGEKIPFVRVDLYEISGNVYFGELTFTPCGGFMPFLPPEADFEVGDMLDISECKAKVI